MNLLHMTSGAIGASDVDILVSLKENHSPTANYVRDLRKILGSQFPGVTFYFLPADIVTQILNFGLPSPIDVQIEGNDSTKSHDIAVQIMEKMHPEGFGRPDKGGAGWIHSTKRLGQRFE
jgi:hypothetical protein